MKSDKTAFLLLTGIVSSLGLCALMVGCTIHEPGPEEPETADEAIEAANAEAGAATTAPSTTTTGTDAGAPKTTTPAKDAGTTTTKDSGTIPPKDGGTDAAVACLNDTAPVPNPACPTVGAGDECAEACANFDGSWKKGVAADIRKCLTAQICQGGTTATCADKALAKTCADATTTAFCTPNVTGCKGANANDTLTQASCEGLAKGLSAAGRTSLRTCFEQEFNCGDCIAKFK